MNLPSHPWHLLIIANGELFYANPPPKGSPYLDTPEICVVAKKQAISRPDKGVVVYSFQLNHSSDAYWNVFFRDELNNTPSGMSRSDLLVEIQSNMLSLTCQEVNLQTKYQFTKDCIQRANSRYAKYKKEIFEKVAQREIELRKEAEAKKEADQSVQKAFDDLKI